MTKEDVLYTALVQAKLSKIQKDKFKYVAKRVGFKQSEYLRNIIDDIITDFEKENGKIII